MGPAIPIAGFHGYWHVIQALGSDIPNAKWGLRVIGVRCCRMGGPGAMVDAQDRPCGAFGVSHAESVLFVAAPPKSAAASRPFPAGTCRPHRRGAERCGRHVRGGFVRAQGAATDISRLRGPIAIRNLFEGKMFNFNLTYVS